MAPPRSASPRFLRSAFLIMDVSLGQMLWSRRSIFLGLVVGAPVVLAVLIRALRATSAVWQLSINGASVSGPALFGLMIWLLYVRFIVPVLGVFYGTALIADEVDDKTITYLFTRPISRGSVVVGKYLAFLLCTVLLTAPSVVLVYFLIVPIGAGSIGAEFPALLRDISMLFVGLAAYGALFSFIGARMRRPLVIGLVFALGWEPAVLLFPGYLKQLTVGYYLQAMVPHAMPQDSTVGAILQLFRELPTLSGSLTALAVITAGSLWLAARTVETKEYVLEQ